MEVNIKVFAPNSRQRKFLLSIGCSNDQAEAIVHYYSLRTYYVVGVFTLLILLLFVASEFLLAR